jgi:hypothetical protein
MKDYLMAASISDLIDGIDDLYGGWYFTKSGKLAPLDTPLPRGTLQSVKFFKNSEIKEALKRQLGLA